MEVRPTGRIARRAATPPYKPSKELAEIGNKVNRIADLPNLALQEMLLKPKKHSFQRTPTVPEKISKEQKNIPTITT